MSETAAAGVFTVGVTPERYHLPHQRIGLPVILLVHRVLLRAFDLLQERGFPLGTEKEDRITEQLFNIIENDLRQTGEIKGFNGKFYERVVRHAQVTNYSGAKLAKAPDLSFKLRYDEVEPRPVISAHDALFIECKPVDDAHFAGGDYCDDGLYRFVNGDYAWAMQEAMMLAYARHGRTLAGHLLPAMGEDARMKSLQTEQMPTASPAVGARATKFTEVVHVSRHRRGFQWPDGKGPATPIDVFHVWCLCG